MSHCRAMPDSLEVTLQQGSLKGKFSYALDNPKPVFTFLNIPYAAPPLGELRLMSPHPPQPWSGVRDATRHGLPSPQDLPSTAVGFRPTPILDVATSEDCLYLNIYSPDMEGNKPVMFWIHGGSLCKGMSSLYDGTAYCSIEDVVIVTVNYRLGALGFLTTVDDSAPGNYGILDQIAALQWVQSNITAFGGDPNHVTIFGESAGALSVQALLLSPSTEGLFHRAISQSAAALIPNIIPPTARTMAFDLGQELGCATADSTELVKHLRQVPVAELVKAQTKFLAQGRLFFLSVDGHVLKDHPERLYSAGGVRKVPHLIVVNSDEGFYFLATQYPGFLADDFDEEACLKCLSVYMDRLFHDKGVEVLEAMKSLYLTEDVRRGRNTADDWRMLCSDVFGEAFLTAPTYRSACYHARAGAVTYFGELVHKPSYSVYPRVPRGAAHAEDLLLNWGDPFMERPVNSHVNYSQDDRQLSKIYMKYWANFAKTGNPNDGQLPCWAQFDTSTRKYIELGTPVRSRDGFRSQNMKFWNETVTSILAN